MMRRYFFGKILRGALGLSIGAACLGFGGAGAAQIPEALLTKANPNVRALIAVQEAVTPGLLALPEILGTAVGLDANGELAVIIYVNQESQNRDDVVRALPPRMRGARVAVELTEPFRPLAGRPPGGGGGGISHTAKQTPPIQLGTSGGWGDDLANGYCCGGTLGGLVQIKGDQYILSNYHVLEADIVAGGNGLKAEAGGGVIQPALIDVNCNAAIAQPVAALSGIKSLPNSNVDAAIARVLPGMVRTDGSILGIGTLSSQTAEAALNKAVKKRGRTTGLTRSVVSGLNANISVRYDNECAGGPAFTKTFTGQMVVKNLLKGGKSFLGPGDSGSVMVEDASSNPKAIGLLFAGSNTTAIANPIDEVLQFFEATMVGQ